MSDLYFVDCCAPTLANIKIASMFNCHWQDPEDFNCWLRSYNLRFRSFGLHMYVLRTGDGHSLVYLFRVSQLRKVLSQQSIRAFLSQYGYPEDTSHIYQCLQHLRKRTEHCCSSSFPHEIGIFLGYPLCDVYGFIQNHGQNCKMSGLWKVYGNVEESRRLFERYQKCRRVYSSLWENGSRTILQMIVSG